MNIKSLLREQLKRIGQYFRAESGFIGDDVLFEPQGFYEAISDDEYNAPIYKYDTFWISKTPEVAASKIVGGAVLGASSMLIHHKKLKPNTFIYIYQLAGIPDKDISHWDIQDFAHLQEVRYRKPVAGKYIGRVQLTKNIVSLFNTFYEIMARQDSSYWESQDDIDTEENPEIIRVSDMINDGSFDKFLNSIKPTK